MKKNFFLFFIFIIQLGFAQIEDAWVYFNDKPNAATYLANPLSMLTQRSIDRRTAQGISIDVTDVPIEPTYISQIASSTGITVMAKSKWLNALHIRGTQADIQALTGLSFVNHITFANHSLNPGGRLSGSTTRVGAVNKNLDALINYNYGGSTNQIEMLNGHLLHQQNYTGQGKIIAVLDSGFIGVNSVAPFQNLINNSQILGGYNFPDGNSNIYTRHNHGTMVLSTMGGYADGQLVGTAPNASYYLFITEDVNSENPVEESYWVEGAELADYYGVDVINSSLGYFDYDNPNYSHQYDDMIGTKTFASRGANMAFSKGIVVVVSAGNSGATAEPHIATPADAFGALTIGAVQSNESYAAFSSIGPSYDGRVKPDVCAKGQAATVSNTSGTIVTANGTSFSGPIMAGMVATFWSAVPTLTATQVVNFIRQSADQYTTPTPQKGYGIPDFQLALNNALHTTSFTTESNFTLVANPVENDLKFNFGSTINEGKLSLFNALGQIILEIRLTKENNSIDVQNLSNGLYYYNFESTQNFKGKIIKK
ncbi:Probable S8 subtilisin family serine endopeptidase precursor [Flavobacterium indicum GPTSA100-9 = DSM 17447]|uniref:Probable S8 subtilisin family serine endopeptidase n=1 Tax=Flavobacterium indicum (strain DSM 17447 / CIP 109464 / GPTSA100-9) TaxID=1094466 RepID=H8XPJ4_FLAIG|nr:S8 family serine peptidase [Flavobacterium indicum]CCG53268.1 Probable S8 subtilisin family serine endopeptidase precursor [Flavobacterium indicum GPTSA100-9 = DSM 17447]